MKNYKLSVPEPCSEDWNAMLPVEQGRFCSLCSKNVVDFTGMTDAQVVAYMQGKSNKVCGRFKATQLETIVINISRQALYSQTQFHKMFLMALLVVMGTSLFSCTDNNGSSKKIDEVVVVDSLPQSNGEDKQDPDSEKTDSVPYVIITSATSTSTPTTGAVAVEPVTPDDDFLMGDVAYLPDSLVPPVMPVKEVKTPALNPDNHHRED